MSAASPRSLVEWLRAAILSPGAGGVLARGSLGSFGVRVGATASLFAMHLLLARLLGATSYGNYVYAITWVQVLALFSTAGMDLASARYVAEYQARNEPRLLHGFLRHAWTLALVASLTVAVVLLGFVTTISPRIEPELATALRVGALLLPLATLLEVRSGALRGYKRVVFARLPVDVLRPVLITVGLGACYWIARVAISAPIVMILYVLATGAGIVAIEAGLRRVGGTGPGEGHGDSLPRRDWTGVGVQLLLVAGFTLILGQTDTLMLGALRNTTDAGIYAVATRFASLVSFALVAVNIMIGPQIAELHSTGRRRELQRVLTLGARVSVGFAVPVAVVLALGGRVALGAFGEEFAGGRTALLVLVAGNLVLCVAGSVGMLMTMTGHQSILAWVLGVGALVNVALNAVLIPPFGMLGAAAATSVTMLAWNSVLVFRAVRLHRLNSTVISLGRR